MIERDSLFSEGGSTYGGLNFSGNPFEAPASWHLNAPWTKVTDSDNDGIVDYLDRNGVRKLIILWYG